MPEIDPRVDAYIERSAPFAQPILKHLRSLVHKACPQVQETIKWSFPHFEYKGILCSMASFKQHCAFSFMKASLMKDADLFLQKSERSGMGHFEKITSIKDLPPDARIIGYVKEAMILNDNNIKRPRKVFEKKELETPVELTKALKSNKSALEHWNAFSYSAKKEYVEWISDAKTEATREKRIASAMDWISDGKGRNWKYEKKLDK